jgi:cytidylate kinase
MNNKNTIIAIDGPAASGKGTIAKRLAKYLGYAHLDTGKLYRVVGYKISQKYPNLTPEIADTIHSEAAEIAASITTQDTELAELETETVGRYASIVSAMPQVREALLKFQQNFAQTPPNGLKGAVLDGRDIGTVIAPDADFKFFITASADTRANRRFLQLQSAGKSVTEAAILQDILARDKRDMERKTAPLKPADDAVIIDTTNASIDEVFEQVLKICQKNYD